QNLTGAENVSGGPVEGGPIDAETQVALPLRGETTNRRTIEGQVVPALYQEFFVIVQHVKPAFEIAKEDGHGLDSLLVGQVLKPLLLDLVRCDPGFTLFLSL